MKTGAAALKRQASFEESLMVPPMSIEEEKSLAARAAFLSAAGWGNAQLAPLAGDASTRCYMRAEHNGRRAALMIAPPAAETAPCPPEADDAERRRLGYNAMARLAGPNLNAFVAIAEALTKAGLSAPQIYAADAKQGFALIEDLGDDLYARIAKPKIERALYENAVDVLLKLRENPPAMPAHADYKMLPYDGLALKSEVELLIDWYWPLKKDAPIPDDLRAEYLERFSEIIDRLSTPHGIVLRDYHAENLLWMPSRQGAGRTGVIDFQDGLYGHAAYDLVSLLEDARRDVAPDLANAMIEHYINRADGLDRDAFMNDYAILAAQRNAKILGIFARLAKRDGKPRYLDLLPRVEAHFRGDLKRDALAPLSGFMKKHFPELAS